MTTDMHIASTEKYQIPKGSHMQNAIWHMRSNAHTRHGHTQHRAAYNSANCTCAPHYLVRPCHTHAYKLICHIAFYVTLV